MQEGPGKANNYTVQSLSEAILFRTAQGDQNLLNNVERPVNDVIDTIRGYPEAKEWRRKAQNYDKDVKAAYEKGKAEGSSGEFVQVTEELFRRKKV